MVADEGGHACAGEGPPEIAVVPEKVGVSGTALPALDGDAVVPAAVVVHLPMGVTLAYESLHSRQ